MSIHDNDTLETELEESSPPDLGGAFDSDDSGINSALQIKSKVTVKEKVISIDDIITPEFKKISRQKSLIGLTGVIGEWGIVSPIHVLKLEDDVYMVLDGLRRLFGALRSGKTDIPAKVWTFEDTQEGKEKSNLISLMINRSQRYTPAEMWEQMQILEEVNGATPGLIEYLLQMNSGDAMKLKDVMLSDIEYSEIRNDLSDGILTIEQAYKKLTAERRKENKLAKEDAMVIDESGDSDLDDVTDSQQLSVDDVKDLLDLTENDISDETIEDLDRSKEAMGEPNVQDKNDRKPIDPKIKEQTFIRDGHACRCCGKGAPQWLGVLVYHHVIPVFLGGEDSVDNGLTICTSCHITLHLYSFGKVTVKFDELSDAEKEIFKKIFKFGNIIIEAMKRTKTNKDVAYKADAGSRRHLYPGEGLKANTESYKKSLTLSSSESSESSET